MSLLQLAEDCPRLLPRLKELVIQFEGGIVDFETGHDESLVARFAEKGIRLTVVDDIDVPAMLNNVQ